MSEDYFQYRMFGDDATPRVAKIYDTPEAARDACYDTPPYAAAAYARDLSLKPDIVLIPWRGRARWTGADGEPQELVASWGSIVFPACMAGVGDDLSITLPCDQSVLCVHLHPFIRDRYHVSEWTDAEAGLKSRDGKLCVMDDAEHLELLAGLIRVRRADGVLVFYKRQVDGTRPECAQPYMGCTEEPHPRTRGTDARAT